LFIKYFRFKEKKYILALTKMYENAIIFLERAFVRTQNDKIEKIYQRRTK
jgi:hypothetical protein